jgi:RNA methyltransferase, TrmH family
MVDIRPISSFQNPSFRNLVGLHSKKARKKSHLFLIEGLKEIQVALKYGWSIQEFWCVEDRVNDLGSINVPRYVISKEMFSKVGYREKTEGIVAIAKQRTSALSELKDKDGLVFVVENLEKPGNLGSLFRIADGVGALGIILCDQQMDLFNPNVIRNSVGTVLSVPFFNENVKDVQSWLSKKGFQSIVATPESSTVYTDHALSNRCAIVVGNEHDGVSDSWKLSGLDQVSIPMNGGNDSLNVSVSMGVLAYEWLRQQ